MDETVRVSLQNVGRISVDVNKFGRGMEKTLAGMAEVWGSLGVVMPSDYEAVPPSEQRQKGEPKEAAKAEKSTDQPADEPVKTPQVTAISFDNITGAIVAKINQNKNNNAAIQKILTGYNVAKVSELKPEQYEAFMADLARL